MKISGAFRFGTICFVLANAAGFAQAQTISMPPPRKAPAPAVALAVAPAAASALTAPSNLTATPKSTSQIDLSWTASTETGGTITRYSLERCVGSGCTNFAQVATATTTSFSDNGLLTGTAYVYRVRATDNGGTNSSYSNSASETTLPPPSANGVPCSLAPARSGCMSYGNGKNANINTFYNTDGQFSFFNQIKSIYNGASGSATVSANLASLNFPNGMQVAVVTNVQAGSSGSTTASSGAIPTLSANGAAQATQNMLYGGTVYAAVLYPLLAVGADKPNTPGNFGILVDLVGREGVDIQNFKSGTSISVTSPPSHSNAQIEGYLQYNSINLVPGSTNFAGALFVGGSYGYSYTSHGYAREYGFGNRVNNDIGQVSVGILINGVAKISVSRAFGPSQTYIDGTSMAQTTVNNFKSWSFGITYQAAAPASK
jgi:hypothetical protein